MDIKAGALGDVDAFKQASEAVIREERQKQHHLLANDLEKILYGDLRLTKSVSGVAKEKIPFDQERELPLLSLCPNMVL